MPFGQRTSSPTASQAELLNELRAMARAAGTKEVKFHGTMDGRLVDEVGPGAHPVLANRDGVAPAVEVRRGDYWTANILGNLSAVAGFGGGLYLGLAVIGALALMVGVWGLTALASGRLMFTPMKAGVGHFGMDRQTVLLGKTARMVGVCMMAAGALAIMATWDQPSPIADVAPHYEAPLHGIWGHP